LASVLFVGCFELLACVEPSTDLHHSRRNYSERNSYKTVAYALDEKQTANASGFTNLKLKCEVAGGAEKTTEAGK
jgi:hypothetical protein